MLMTENHVIQYYVANCVTRDVSLRNLSSNFAISLDFSLPDIHDFSLSMISIILGFSLLILLLILKNSPFPIWVTRKSVHFLGGTFIAFMAPLFHSFLSIIISISAFLLIFLVLIFSSKFEIMKEYFVLRDCRENERRFAFLINSTLTLLSMFSIFIIFNDYPGIFTASVLVVSWADTFGEVIGRSFPFVEYKIVNKKTISGSITIFIFCLIRSEIP